MSTLDRVLFPRHGADAALQRLSEQLDRLTVQRLSVSVGAEALAQVLGAARLSPGVPVDLLALSLDGVAAATDMRLAIDVPHAAAAADCAVRHLGGVT